MAFFEFTIWKVLAQVFAILFLTFIYNLYKVRMAVRSVKNVHGIDILPHSFLFGHLLEIDKVMRKAKFPPKAHTHWLPMLFIQEYPELTDKGLIYLDVWPISEPLLAIWHPDLIMQVEKGNFPKAKLMKMEMGPVTDGIDLICLEGAEWKKARSIFNPGFSAKNLLSLMPDFINEIELFKEKLSRAADSGEVIKLEKWTIQLAVDVIGKAVLGQSFNTQTISSPLIDTILAQIPLLYNSLDLRKALNPIRYIKLWYYRRHFSKLLHPYIDQAVKDYDNPTTKTKTILNLAMREDLAGKPVTSLSPDFVRRTTGHFWMFLFAGHDTTAIALAFTFYMLSRNPDKAALLIAEHNTVLGPDPSDAAVRLRDCPTLVNQLPYTNAVFKESLRLWSPVTGGVRSAPPNHFITHPDTGERFPTHAWMINNAGAILHRLPEYWPDPHKFIPERWLTSNPTDPLHPKKGTYRPFESGQRNCIGQELVSIEIRLVLALTVREFDVVDQYPRDGPTFLGERAYSVELPESVVTAHALDQMPVKVVRRRKQR